MSDRARLFQACVACVCLIRMALSSTAALAQQGCCEGGTATGANAWTTGNTTDQTPANIAGATAPLPWDKVFTPVAVEPRPALVKAPVVPGWWSHGEIEFGLRDFVNDPRRDGSIFGDTGGPGGGYAYLGQHSLAKYYEYSTIAPGAFGGGHISTGSNDGLYQADIWANNIGYSDQAYLLSLSKIGEQYFQFSWDQTPHVYSTSAQTPYLGVGTRTLTLPPSLLSNTATSSNIIVPFLHQTDVGIERDTAAASYRWTPTEAWDVRADYSHMDRTGTQAAGISGLAPKGGSVFSSPVEVPAPVNDTTQNFGTNGEYAGTSPWNQRYTVKVAYNGSLYTDNISNYTVQNPYCTGGTAATCGVTTLSPFARISTPPSNAANAVTTTVAADMPLRSRYVGTFNYTSMTQDQTFQPVTANPSAVASPAAFFGSVPWNAVNFGFINGNPADPTTNLNGRIDTILSNNVLTSQITPELSSKLSYRFYNFDNETPRIILPAWVSYDQTGTSMEKTISSLTVSYVKQNAGAELNWRPAPQWNVTTGVGWEHYGYVQADVNATNEYSGKLAVDWKPTSWFTARTSGYFADRTFDTYNYNQFVSSIQFPTVPGFAPTTSAGWFYAPAYQQFMFDNRQRTKANIAFDIVAFRGVTISPTYKYQDDFYGLNPVNQEGITNSRSNSWGVDVGYVVNPYLSFLVSYYWEDYSQTLYNYTSTFTGGGFTAQPGNCTTGALANCLITTSDKEHVNTITAVVNYAAIPDKLNFDARFAVSWSVDQQLLLTAAPTSACSNCQGQFPNNTTLFQRLDMTATYKFDPIWIAQSGFKGDVKAKLRYTWERNAVNNWQNDPLAAFFPTEPTAIWLATNNPNYNVQMLAASLIAAW
jgi:Putative outer membrane beta-barrel porin, MtrB/PioB